MDSLKITLASKYQRDQSQRFNFNGQPGYDV
jgi:hypothetical protein